MKQVKFEVLIDTEDASQVEKACAFLQSLVPGKTAKPAKKKTAPEPETAPEQEPKSDGITVEEIRAILAKKVTKHRSAIKAQLTDLGANNVTSLDPEKYPEFKEFLEQLI